MLLDGHPVFEATHNDAARYATYAPVIIDVSAFADGAAHVLRFESTIDAGAVTNFFVDDVRLQVRRFLWPLFLPAIVSSPQK